MCIWYGEFITSPKKVGDALEAGIYVVNDDNSHISVSVFLKGYNPITKKWRVFGETVPADNGWAGMPLNILTCDAVGTWRMSWNIPDLCGAQSSEPDLIVAGTPCSIECSSLAVDTWKPITTNSKTGANLAITVRSKEFNKAFNIGYADWLTLERHVLMSGTTDATGCFSGEIPAQADGTYNLTVCFLFFGLPCPITNPIHPISVTWGTKPLSWTDMILYSALGLGAAYIIGQVIAKDRREK